MKIIASTIKTSKSDGYTISETITTKKEEHEISSTYLKHSLMNPTDDRKFLIKDTIKRIITLTEGITNFWKSADGWAPMEAANLLSKSRLDWQASLARQLNLFADETNNESGLLILAWATLGSLIEGVLKIYLSVYYKVYQSQNLTNEFKSFKDKKGNTLSPDELMLEKLRLFFISHVLPVNAKEIWSNQGEINWLDWISKIQYRRNAIHAFKNRDLGNIDEFHCDLQNYLIFLRKVNQALPYPGNMYTPIEDVSDNNCEVVSVKIDEREVKGVIRYGKLNCTSKENGEFLKTLLKFSGEVIIVDSLILQSLSEID